jgi:excisionase family DNA binding protein
MKRRRKARRGERAPEEALLLTKEQMAARLQISVRCLEKMMYEGSVSYLKLRGKTVRFRAADVLARLCESSLVCHGAAEDGDRGGE